LIDSQLLEPGETNFNKLNRLYQIMIMPFDLFGYGKYCYTFENQCLEVPGLEIKDDAKNNALFFGYSSIPTGRMTMR
jgi:hypothetical protein